MRFQNQWRSKDLYEGRRINKFLSVILGAFLTWLIAGQSLANADSKISIMSAISEPEDGLIRDFFLELDGKSKVTHVIVVEKEGKTSRFTLDQLIKEEVTIAVVKGIDAVKMQVVSFSDQDGKVRVRYLSRAPSQFETVVLDAKRQPSGAWSMSYQNKPFRWMHFKAKTFLGLAVGVESFEVSMDKPKQAH